MEGNKIVGSKKLINFFLNFFFLTLILLTLGIPIVSWISFIVICFAVAIVITGKLVFDLKKLIIVFIIAAISLTLQFSFSKKIQEGFVIYPTVKPGDDGYTATVNEFLENILPKDVNSYLQKTIKENYSVYIPSTDQNWSFSADGFWQKKSMSRMINNINFENVHELRIGAYNDIKLNINYKNWSPYSLRLPLIIKYILPDKFNNAEICFEGLIYIQNQFAMNEQYDCIKLNKESLEIIAFDLDPLPNLKMKIISKNVSFQFEKLLKLIQPIFASVIILLIGRISFAPILFVVFGMMNYFIYLFDIVFNEHLPSKFSPFIYMARGNDGIVFYSYGREILSYLSEGNIFMALKGGVTIFHFMPGLRYFHSICMIFFGETILGYILLGIMMPFIIFHLLKKFFTKKMSLILIWIFLLIPIFESYGFLHFYYMKLIAKGFGGTLGWFSLFASLSLLLNKKNISLSNNFISGFVAGTLLIIAISCRPNIFPMAAILIIGFSVVYFIDNNKSKLIGIILGSANLFWFTFHNLYYGGGFFLITNSVSNNLDVPPEMWFTFLSSLLTGSLNYNLFSILINHIFIWINYYEIWLMICILSLIILLIKKNINIEIKIISLALLCGHSVFIFYPGVPRYTYGLWVISLIMMIVFINEQTKLFLFVKALIQKIKYQFVLFKEK